MAKTIMVVDDHPDIRSSLKTLLERHGYKVIIAVNGDDCLNKLKTEKPDLILMEIKMSGTPVEEIIPKIKNIKIAYLTVLRKKEAKEEGLLEFENVVDFIEKPFDIKDLVKRVKKIVG